MSTEENDETPMFARGIAGPLGKLTRDMKTKVDEHTEYLFRRDCALSGTDVATVMRDFIYMRCYSKTYRGMVAEKLQHEIDRTGALHALKGPFEGPEFQSVPDEAQQRSRRAGP